MARIHVLLGPYVFHADAAAAVSALASDGYDASRPRVVKLRDRTGPSVAARLATAEQRFSEHHDRLAALESALGEPACIGCGKSPSDHHEPGPNCGAGVFPIVMDRLAHLETEHAALVVRVGELEMLPAPVRPEPGSVAEDPTPEQIEAYLRGSAEWSRRDDGLSGPSSYYWHGGAKGVWLGGSDCLAVIAKHEGVTPAEMHARILAVSPTAEDPDRLAKVAHRAGISRLGTRGEVTWFTASESVRDHYRAIAAAVAEANGLENDVLAKGLDDITAERDTLQAELATLRANRLAKVAEPTDEELDRRFGVAYVNACEAGRHATAHFEGRRALYDLGREHGNRERDALPAPRSPTEKDFARIVSDMRGSDPTPADYVEAGYDFGAERHRRECRALMAKAAKVRDEREADLLARAERAEAEVRSRDAELDAAEKLLPAEFRCEPALLGVDGIPHLIADWQKRGEELEAMRAATPRRTAEGERADAVAFWETRIKQHPRGSSEYRAMRATLDQFEFGEHVGAAARSATRPGAPTPTAPDATRDPLTDPREGDWFFVAAPNTGNTELFVEVVEVDGGKVKRQTWFPVVPAKIGGGATNDVSLKDWRSWCRSKGARPMTPAEVQAFQRDGTRPTATRSEAEMAAELRAEGWEILQGFSGLFAMPAGGHVAKRLADAHAAMRAAKGEASTGSEDEVTTMSDRAEKGAVLRETVKAWIDADVGEDQEHLDKLVEMVEDTRPLPAPPGGER